MKHNIHNYIAKTAIDYAGITPEEVRDISMRQDGTLVEVDFATEWMSYICYIDLSGEVFGFLSEPVTEHETDGIDKYVRDRCGICA